MSRLTPDHPNTRPVPPAIPIVTVKVPPTDKKSLQATEVTRIIKNLREVTCKQKCHPPVKYYIEQNK